MSAPLELKSYRFRAEREASWRELDALVTRVEERGMKSLDASELFALPGLYRSALSSLSVARAISLDKNALAYLESLCARAYVCVYGVRRRGLAVLGHFLRRGFPALVWGMRRELALALVLLAAGIAAGIALTLADSERFYSFVDPTMAAGRGPSASRETLAQALFDGDDSPGAFLSLFASFLFTHNAKIGLFCFTLGIVVGVPTALLLFANGLTLGAMIALYAQADLGVDFLAWVLGHGVTELLAVALCAAAGFVLGRSLVFPGRHGRLDSLAKNGRRAGAVAAGSVLMFFIAALLEGFFRQLVPDTALRAAVASATGVLWIAYFWSGKYSAAREAAAESARVAMYGGERGGRT